MADERFGKRGWVFSQVPIWAACDPRIKDKAFRLLVYLVWRQGTDAGCWPSVNTISKDLGSTRRTVQRNLENLQELGYVERKERRGKSSVYFAIADPGDASGQFTPGAERQTKATPAPDRVVPPPRKRKPVHPAVALYRHHCHMSPPGEWSAKIIKIVGAEERDLEFWGKVLEAWTGTGYSPKNAKGMIDWFERGAIPERRDGNGRQRTGERGGKRERPRVAAELGDWEMGDVPDLS